VDVHSIDPALVRQISPALQGEPVRSLLVQPLAVDDKVRHCEAALWGGMGIRACEPLGCWAWPCLPACEGVWVYVWVCVRVHARVRVWPQPAHAAAGSAGLRCEAVWAAGLLASALPASQQGCASDSVHVCVRECVRGCACAVCLRRQWWWAMKWHRANTSIHTSAHIHTTQLLRSSSSVVQLCRSPAPHG